MKIYGSTTVNSQRVKILLKEKGIDIEWEDINIFEQVNRTEEFRKLNTLAEVPVLQFDDNSTLCESIAICRYFEALYPVPLLFGSTAQEIGYVEMWNRRAELHLLGPLVNAIEHSLPGFADKLEQVPEFSQAQMRKGASIWTWLDSELDDGRDFLAGGSFSVADITGAIAFGLTDFLKIQVPDDLGRVSSWIERVTSRASFQD